MYLIHKLPGYEEEKLHNSPQGDCILAAVESIVEDSQRIWQCLPPQDQSLETLLPLT